MRIKNFYIEVIANLAATGLISAGSILLKKPQMIPIILFIAIIVLLLTLHSYRKNLAINDGQQATFDFIVTSPKFRIFFASLAILIISAAFGFLIYPATADPIQVFFWGTPTTSLTEEPTATPSPPGSTPPAPSPTPKKSVTPTPTLVPNPLIDFKTGCISQAWHPWYGNFQEEKSNDSKSSSDPFCWDLHNEGLEADSSGLRIFQKANDSKQVFGIFADVPEGRFSLKIDFVINELQIQLEHKDIANFFVGFVDSANTDLKGNLFVFQIPSNDLFPLVYLEDKIPFEKDTPYIESLKNYGSGITITGERDGWSINYVISGVINPDIEKNGQTFSNAWDKLLIGYSLYAGASVDMRITNIELGSEP